VSHPFVDSFIDLWRAPSAERLLALLDDDVVLLQPHRPPLRGKAQAAREFERLFAWLPGLRGSVTRSATNGEVVFIEWNMHVPLGARDAVIPAVDRFVLRNGHVVERCVYFDQTLLIRAVATTPRLWRGYLRYRFGV